MSSIQPWNFGTFSALWLEPVTPRVPLESLKSAILVVEDDLLLRFEMVDNLQDAGFEVVEAGSADEAIQVLAARHDIRIVFTDVQMPGSMDGIQLAAAVRDRWPPIDIIITSGRSDIRKQDIPARGLFLSKPVSPVELVKVMREMTSRR